MRAIVCGGRDFPHSPTVYYELSSMHRERPFTLIITGGARGVDEFAHHWAERNGVPTQLPVANWSEHGRKAGPIRNQAMLAVGKPDLVVAFPGGRGTMDMVRRAEAAGVPVHKVYE